MGEIVIGVDGSEASHRALRWGLDESRLRGHDAVVVHAYRRHIVRDPYATGYPYLPADTVQVATEHERQLQDQADADALRHAEGVIQRALDEAGSLPDGPPVKRLPVARDVAKTLIEMSDHAELLVIGSRGLGGFRGLLLGSVSQQCVHHARCPVTIIR